MGWRNSLGGIKKSSNFVREGREDFTKMTLEYCGRFATLDSVIYSIHFATNENISQFRLSSNLDN